MTLGSATTGRLGGHAYTRLPMHVPRTLSLKRLQGSRPNEKGRGEKATLFASCFIPAGNKRFGRLPALLRSFAPFLFCLSFSFRTPPDKDGKRHTRAYLHGGPCAAGSAPDHGLALFRPYNLLSQPPGHAFL